MDISAREELLVGRWSHQDPEALEEILEEYGRPLYGFLSVVLLCDEQKAQELFLRILPAVLKSTEFSRGEVSLSLQIFGRAVKEVQKHSNRFSLDLSGHSANASPDFAMPCIDTAQFDKGTKARLSFFIKALAGINLQDRLLLLQRDQLQLSHREIAQLMGADEHEIKNQLITARLHFRAAMEKAIDRKRS